MSDTPRTDALISERSGYPVEDLIDAVDLCRVLECELAEAQAASEKARDQRDAMARHAIKMEAENAALRYVVEKAAQWDVENTDNADLAALGAYARAALAKNPEQTTNDLVTLERAIAYCEGQAARTDDEREHNVQP
jgi:hypothetical protein